MALTPKQIEWLNSHPELRPRYSMKRRNEYHDYTSRSIYMITLVVEGLRSLLGSLCDKDENHNIPWIDPSRPRKTTFPSRLSQIL